MAESLALARASEGLLANLNGIRDEKNQQENKERKKGRHT
jgi:hypothetical protein